MNFSTLVETSAEWRHKLALAATQGYKICRTQLLKFNKWFEVSYSKYALKTN